MNSWAITLAYLAFLASLLGLFSGCSPTLVKTTPKLPPGFQEARVPSGHIAAYLYFSQESPTNIPREWFEVNREGTPKAEGTPAIPNPLAIDRLAAWVGPDVDSFAAAVEFQEGASAQAASTAMAALTPPVAHWITGKTLFLAQGSDAWAEDMEASLRSGGTALFKEAYPSVWDLLHLMPGEAPGKPLAVGFARVDEGLLSSLSTRANLEIKGLGQAFGAINVNEVAFVAYADAPLALPQSVGPDYFQEAGLGAIFVARSTYPGFVLSFFLGSFADTLGLEKGPTVNGQEVLVKEIEGAHIMVVSLGNTFYLALAPSREKAEALMTSALASHGKG